MRHPFLGLKNQTRSILLVLVGIAAMIAGLGCAMTGLIGPKRLTVGNALPAYLGLASLLKGIDLMRSSFGGVGDREGSRASLGGRQIALLGGISLSCLAVYAILTYGLAPLVPFSGIESFRAKLAERLARMMSFLGRDAQAFLRGQTALAQQEIWLLAYCLPILAATAVALTLLALLSRHRHGLEEDAPRHLFLWAAAFAVIGALACPVLVLDFWYPVAWGRMVAAGLNPYHQDIPPEFIRDLPLGEELLGVRMMYGPLWALVYGAAMGLVGSRALLGAAVFKLLLAAAWIGSLRLVWAMLRERSVWHQCVGIVILGWLPFGVIQGIGDGHNDVFMVFCVLLWMYALYRGRSIGANLALAASVLVKYVSAPLFLLDLMYHVRSERRRLLAYLPRGIAAFVLLAGVTAVFYRSPDFFAYLPDVSRWSFFSPVDAVIALEYWMGWDLPLGTVARSIFALAALYFVARYWQRPTADTFRQAALAVMSAMLFSVSRHVWPWYGLWVLALAALVPRSSLAVWAVAVVLMMPFLILVWVVYPEAGLWPIFGLPALFFYAFALLWLAVVPRRWFPDTATLQQSSRSVGAP